MARNSDIRGRLRRMLSDPEPDFDEEPLMHPDKYSAKGWMTTYSGIQFEFCDPTRAMFNLDDACRALAMTNRFLGHTLRPYSVAEHLCRGHDVAILRDYPVAVQNEYLIHDMAEAYYGDIPSPVKALLGEAYSLAENRWQQNINYLILGYFEFNHKSFVKQLDYEMCCTEAGHLTPNAGDWWKKGFCNDIVIPKVEFHWTAWSTKLKEKVEAVRGKSSSIPRASQP